MKKKVTQCINKLQSVADELNISGTIYLDLDCTPHEFDKVLIDLKLKSNRIPIVGKKSIEVVLYTNK